MHVETQEALRPNKPDECICIAFTHSHTQLRLQVWASIGIGIFQGRKGAMVMVSSEHEPITGGLGWSLLRNPGAEFLVRGQGKSPLKIKDWSICTPKGRPKTLLSVHQDHLNMSPGSSPRRPPLSFPASREASVPWTITMGVHVYRSTLCGLLY